MAVAICYVNPATGADDVDTRDGSWALPYKSIQYALDNPADWSANVTAGSNEIRLVAGTADVLSASISFATFATVVTTAGRDNLLTIRGNAATGAGDHGMGEINGNDAVSSLFNTTGMIHYIFLVDLKLHDTTDDVIQITTNGCALIGCEVYNSPNSYHLIECSGTYFRVFGCYLHGFGTASRGITCNQPFRACWNFIDGATQYGIYTSNADSIIYQNIIIVSGCPAIYLGNMTTMIFNNTFVGNAQAGEDGINGGSASEMLIAFNNLFVNMDQAINVLNSNFLILGNNHRYGCLAADSAIDFAMIDLRANDITTNPQFVDTASDNYAVGANCRAGGWPSIIFGSNTKNYMDVGAVQRPENFVKSLWRGGIKKI